MTKARLRQNRRQTLWQSALACEKEFAATLEQLRGCPVPLFLSENDRLRLLTLWVWMRRYKVSMLWILTMLFQRYAHFTKRKTHTSLGMRIATLCGRTSQNYIEEEILRQFPESENYAEWRSQEQQRQLRSTRTFTVSNPFTYTQDYHQWVQRNRTKIITIAEAMQRWPYRDNPWL